MAKKLSPFEQAFADARADNKKTFEYNGKTYGTATMDDVQKKVNAMPSMSRTTGAAVTTQGATYPKDETPKPKARSLVDQGRDVDIYKNVDKDAVLEAGLGMASLYPAVRAGRAAYTAARPVVGAAVKKVFSEDGLLPTFNRAEDPRPSTFETLTPENQAASQRYREAYDDRPGPMKKGGAVKKYAKGGKISLDACGVSTHKPAKKKANW